MTYREQQTLYEYTKAYVTAWLTWSFCTYLWYVTIVVTNFSTRGAD